MAEQEILTRCISWRVTESEYQALKPFFDTFERKTDGMRWLLGTRAVQQLMRMRAEDAA